MGGNLARHALSFVLLLATWQFAALLLPGRHLPPPTEVARVLVQAATEGDLPRHLAATLGRVLASFALAMGLGAVLGIVMGRCRRVDGLLDGWLVFFLNLPALVTTILCYVWFGLTEAALLAAVAANKVPGVAVTLREGARTLDPAFQDLARIYRFGPWKTLSHVVLPQLAPYLLVAARSGLALIWKIVLMVELLGRSDGIGFKLHVFFQMFDVAGILAYSLAFIAVIQVIELALLAPIERRTLAWRQA
jgi:NitT/TauT family transport system permease protein